jgi:chromosome segregation ATPase
MATLQLIQDHYNDIEAKNTQLCAELSQTKASLKAEQDKQKNATLQGKRKIEELEGTILSLSNQKKLQKIKSHGLQVEVKSLKEAKKAAVKRKNELLKKLRGAQDEIKSNNSTICELQKKQSNEKDENEKVAAVEAFIAKNLAKVKRPCLEKQD